MASFVTGYLRPAERQGAVEIWSDRLMPGSADWRQEIEGKLRACDVFILLVSPNSMASGYVVEKEIAVIRERQANSKDVHFYPLLLTPTPDIAVELVQDKNLRPRDRKPFSSYSLNDRQQHMADAANEIAKIAREIAARKSEPAPSLLPTAPQAPERIVASSLPPNPRMIGRADRLDELVAAILNEDRPIVVPGALGMGKTTLALAATHDPRVIAHFGKGRRFFVNCEPLLDADGLLRRFAAELGLAASGAVPEVEAEIGAACAGAPTLAIIDNLETPWRRDPGATEALLGRLAAFDGLRLVITVRGEPPNVPGQGAITLQDVERLDETDARALFLRRAGGQFAADPALPDLLRALDGHPLSIELLAANAAGKSNLKGLAADWNDRRADMLQRGAADDRKTSLSVSLLLSLDALRPPSPAHRLIRLMALLPDGMADADSRTILSDSQPTTQERGAAGKLESARLARRPDDRWRLLATVRELLLAEFPPEADDRTRLVNLFLVRAAKGGNAGRDGWREVRDEVVAEAGNLDAMIGVALRETSVPQGVSSAVSGLAEFHRFTGLASIASLRAAAKQFRDVGHLLDEANCVHGLGDIALARSDHEGARERYEAALPLYQKVGNVVGEANCVQSLGDIALERADHGGARERYEAALSLYHNVGSVLGEANCVRSLGDIALARSDHEGARERYEAALPLYQKVGSVLGEANCIYRLGEIALARSDHEGARERFEAALPLYQKVGNVVGEANCVQRLGDIEEEQRKIPAACEHWREALALFARILDPYSIGFSHWRLARRAAAPEEAAEHREAAREAWASIDRPDLIEKHLGKRRVSKDLTKAARAPTPPSH